jgi:hypothetical protein
MTVPEPDDFADLPSFERFGDELHAAAARAYAANVHGRGMRGAWREAAATRRPRRPSGRGLSIVVATLVVAGSAMAAVTQLTSAPRSGARNMPGCMAAQQRSSICPQNARFDPRTFVVHGDRHSCVDFATQADAQAVLRADPADPNHLDDEGYDVRDGVACPQLIPHGARDLVPVQAIVDRLGCGPMDIRSARCPRPSQPFDPGSFVRFGVDEYDCEDFADQADAQAVLRYSPQDPNDLDGDGDGIACPDLPAPRDLAPVATRPPG